MSSSGFGGAGGWTLGLQQPSLLWIGDLAAGDSCKLLSCVDEFHTYNVQFT